MIPKEYRLLQENTSDDEVHLRTPHRRQNLTSGSLPTFIVSVVLSFSLAANILWIIQSIRSTPGEPCSSQTAFGRVDALLWNFDCNVELTSLQAGLERNVPIAWTHDNDFVSHNRTTWDQAWETVDKSQGTGVVAIDDDFVEKTGLPKAQRWPWDKSKGLYLLQGYHNLHCL
ncbi:hypothetical protein MMC28_009339, partial [Mycoblastus sanguinarius]|nr:hypothetical protein [Mycoblastus sanguinarius]